LSAAILLTAASQAALLPERFTEFNRTSFSPITVEDKSLWQEYGLEAAEQATYAAPAGTFKAEVYRLKDPTSAMAVFQWKKPANSKPSNLRGLAVETATGAALTLGNYYVVFDGRIPKINEIQELFVYLPRVDQSALPALRNFLPTENRIDGSERYVVGPAGLAKFENRISPSTAAFSQGAEAQLATFKSPAGNLNLAIFAYPTPQIAREKASEFQNIPGAVVKRSVSLVAVTILPPSADEAERLLAKVTYTVNITRVDNPKNNVQSLGSFIISVFILIGVLIGLTIFAGLAFALARILRRKWNPNADADDAMLTLHLEDR
jgi:hypothetical protein